MPAAIMVQGCTSDAGKSFIATALCRHFSNLGYRVAPFKAQNMSNNSRVVAGGEIGTAQWLQARAARVEPTVFMNPVLLKPEADTRSQVVVLGRYSRELTETPWRGRSEVLWEAARTALDSLMSEYEIVVIEGAGSPAEINLSDSDYVNMRVAEYAGAAVLLVSDIDRGGAFAHLYGTAEILPAKWKQLISGFVLNKFRGDPALLDPGPRLLEELTSIPTVALVPMVRHGLPNEEGPSLGIAGTGRSFSIICGPYASNLDEFADLQRCADVNWVRSVDGFGSPEFLIIPGSKNTAADLAWLRETGLERSIRDAAGRGVPVLGICGGMQILGGPIADPASVESGNTVHGLGLLPVSTTFSDAKRTERTTWSFPKMAGPWKLLSDLEVSGYEIRFGISDSDQSHAEVRSGQCYSVANVMGIYTHGLFENAGVLEAFDLPLPDSLDDEIDRLSTSVMAGFDQQWLTDFQNRVVTR